MARYQVGEYAFGKKGAVKELLSDVLKSHEPGDRVTDPFVSGLLTALVREHPEAAEKIGPGIEHWVICSNNDLQYSTKGFRVKQIGREGLVKFSYTDVLAPPTQRALVGEALTREAIDITQQLRTDAFSNGPVKCAYTGEEITEKTDAAAVHHSPARAELHKKFLASEGLSDDTVTLVKHPADSGFRLEDRGLAQRWRDFQLAHLKGMAIVKIRRH
jgi:hypothetical protein